MNPICFITNVCENCITYVAVKKYKFDIIQLLDAVYKKQNFQQRQAAK